MLPALTAHEGPFDSDYSAGRCKCLRKFLKRLAFSGGFPPVGGEVLGHFTAQCASVWPQIITVPEERWPENLFNDVRGIFRSKNIGETQSI